jgi:flagellar biosynthesis regulator FlaF
MASPASQEPSRHEIARSLAEVESLAVLARAIFKRIDRRGCHGRLWDAVNEDLAHATESLEDLQAEVRAEVTSSDRIFSLKQLIEECP